MLDTQIAATLRSILEEIIDDLELDYDDDLAPQTRLIADLGFASTDFIHLIVEIETKFSRKLGFHDLLMPEGTYIDDLTLGTLEAFVTSRMQQPVESSAPPVKSDSAPSAVVPASTEPPVTEADLATYRSLMPASSEWGIPPAVGKRNPRAAFLLSSSRSGSTLLRVILAGHPQLFAPPELHLLLYPDMQRRRKSLDNPLNAHLLTGAIRAFMQIRDVSSEEAAAFVAQCESDGMPVHEFYGRMLEELGDRLLIDKSPTYAMRPEFLARARDEFEEPLFIHLVRHPCGMIKSFQDGKMDQYVPFMRESHFSRRQLAELTWLATNSNISDFLTTIPANRQLRLNYDTLVAQPGEQVARLCEFLQVPFLESMLQPYDDQHARMTDSVKNAAEFSGDLKFHLHAGIDPAAAAKWRGSLSESSLGAPTRALSRQLDIQLEAD